MTDSDRKAATTRCTRASKSLDAMRATIARADAARSDAAHYLTGSANVSAATGGGEIKVTGLGPALGVAWGGASPYYAGAGYALTVYDIDLSSSTRGRLHAGGTGYGHSVDLEMGRHIALGERMTLTPRARAVGSRVSVDAFTDAVDARVSFPTTDRLMSSAGVVAETAPAWEDGAFSLRGSVDLERLLGGTETIAQVSGERLSLDAAANSVRASLRAVFRQGPVSVAAEGWLREGLDASAREYAGTLNVGIRF